MTWPDIEAWARLHGVRPTRYELDCLAHLDGVYVRLRVQEAQAAARRRA